MKILFYVEPHALRDSFTSHSYPYKTFLNICRQIKHVANSDIFEDVDVRVFSNHVLQQVRFEETLDMWPLLLTPTSTEQQTIEDMATMWLPRGINDWIELCSNSESHITKFYKNVLRRIKQNEFDFDVIVSWGQNKAIQDFAKEHRIQTVYVELASMRAPFPMALLMDPVGVNGAASTTHLHIKDIKKYVESIPTNLLLTAMNDELHPTKQSSSLFISKFQPLPWPAFDNQAPVALLPLQLADDANLLLYSNFKSIEEFTDTAIQQLSAHGWNVLIKPHPHASLRGGYVERAQRDALKKYENDDSIKVLNENIESSQYLSLLSTVDLIVTNNSSVGFEGLICGTQCVTMGSACYSIKGGLPTITEFLNASPQEREVFEDNAAAIVTYMTSFMFPLERRVAHQLIDRIKLWKTVSPPPTGDADTWIDANTKKLGWTTWHDGEFARANFLKPVICKSKPKPKPKPKSKPKGVIENA